MTLLPAKAETAFSYFSQPSTLCCSWYLMTWMMDNYEYVYDYDVWEIRAFSGSDRSWAEECGFIHVLVHGGISPGMRPPWCAGQPGWPQQRSITFRHDGTGPLWGQTSTSDASWKLVPALGGFLLKERHSLWVFLGDSSPSQSSLQNSTGYQPLPMRTAIAFEAWGKYQGLVIYVTFWRPYFYYLEQYFSQLLGICSLDFTWLMW